MIIYTLLINALAAIYGTRDVIYINMEGGGAGGDVQTDLRLGKDKELSEFALRFLTAHFPVSDRYISLQVSERVMSSS